MPAATLSLVIITFGAAVVNGALGYGFSSITVPLALLFLTNRVLNPALVVIEVALNAYVLWVNRVALPLVWRRALPVVIGLAPGVAVGTLIVSHVSPSALKLGTFVVLLPMILAQAAGYRRPIRAERATGLVFGGGVGLLYAVTTISGPPLACALNNQGFSKQEFRADPSHPAECPHRRPHRRRRHPPRAIRDVPARVYELRRVGRVVRHFHAAAGHSPRRQQRGVSGHCGRRPPRRLAALPLFLGSAARGCRGDVVCLLIISARSKPRAFTSSARSPPNSSGR
jgi:hypothetical protein